VAWQRMAIELNRSDAGLTDWSNADSRENEQ
jgi:hypothetical protein